MLTEQHAWNAMHGSHNGRKNCQWSANERACGYTFVSTSSFYHHPNRRLRLDSCGNANELRL
jgi:hypothetical protein